MLSSGSIISTASSNSHKNRKKKQDSLQVAGLKVGNSNRKPASYLPAKYDKSSPYLHNLNAAAHNGGSGNIPVKQDFLLLGAGGGNGVSLSGGSLDHHGKGGRASGGAHHSSSQQQHDAVGVSLSIAARKKEMQMQAEQTAQVIEKNKKKVLDALNKNYRKKQQQ